MELSKLTMPKKLHFNEIHKRFHDTTYILFSVYGMVRYLYNKMYDLDLNMYNVTSHNMVHSIIKYLRLKERLKPHYDKIDTNVLNSFYANTKQSLLTNEIKLFREPLLDYQQYFIRLIDNIKTYSKVDKKHYINSLYNEPIYYEPCIHFVEHYDYMYALPFYSLLPMTLIHNTMSDIFTKLKGGIQIKEKNKKQTPNQSGVFDHITFHEYNVINDFFYNIKTHYNNSDNKDTTYPLEIDIMLFKSKINLNSLTNIITKKPHVLGQIYIMTNVNITSNLLIPVIYEELLYTPGVIFSEITPYELSECKINAILKTQTVTYEENNKLSIQNLLETPYNPHKSSFENILFQSLIAKNAANKFLFETTKNNKDSILFAMFVYFMENGLMPSFMLCRTILNVTQTKQSIERNYTNGIFPCGKKIYYLKLVNIQDFDFSFRSSRYLPRGFFMNNTKFSRITQTIFYHKELNVLFFSNLALVDGDVVADARYFFEKNQTYSTIAIGSVIDIIENASILKFKNQQKLSVIKYDGYYINLIVLHFSYNISIFTFTTKDNVMRDFLLYDIVHENIANNRIPMQKYKNTALKDFVYNLLNLHELLR